MQVFEEEWGQLVSSHYDVEVELQMFSGSSASNVIAKLKDRNCWVVMGWWTHGVVNLCDGESVAAALWVMGGWAPWVASNAGHLPGVSVGWGVGLPSMSWEANTTDSVFSAGDAKVSTCTPMWLACWCMLWGLWVLLASSHACGLLPEGGTASWGCWNWEGLKNVKNVMVSIYPWSDYRVIYPKCDCILSLVYPRGQSYLESPHSIFCQICQLSAAEMLLKNTELTDHNHAVGAHV